MSPTSELVAALADAGLGKQRSWLQREEAVQKSAWAPPGHRPTVNDHFRTISVRGSQSLVLESVRRLTVVDDVITTGATLYACARLLAKVHTEATVLAFAVVRTCGDLDQVESV